MGGLEDFVGAVDAGDGDFGFAGAAGIAFEGGLYVGDVVVAGRAVTGLVGEAEVGFAAGDGGVAVVDDEVALRGDAGFDEAAFAGAGLREVHADAEVGGGEITFVERAFAGALQSNEDHGVHRFVLSGKFMRSANRSIILRSGAYGLCCGHGLAAITSVADCREHGRIVPLEQFAAEEIFVREKHALRLRFSSVKTSNTCPIDSIPSEERRTTHDRGEESITTACRLASPCESR